MELLRAGLVGSLLWFVHYQTVGIWGIYAVVAGLAAAATFYDPARLASLPSLVPKTNLVRANSLVMSTKQATFAAGFALGGILILNIGFQALIMLTLMSFVVAALVVSFIVMPKRPAEERLRTKRASIRRDIFDGLTYLRDHPLARPLVTMEILEFVPHAIWTSTLMSVFAEQALKVTPEGWGYQNAAFFGGQLMGAIIATFIATRIARYPGWIIIGNAFLFSMLTLAYAMSPNFMAAIVLCVFFGPTSAVRDVAQDSLLQASINAEVMGRIYATRAMLANLSFMLAGIGFAWLADQIPVRWIYGIGGLLYLGTALYALTSAAIRHSRIVGPISQPVTPESPA